jgi:hypothetical protein
MFRSLTVYWPSNRTQQRLLSKFLSSYCQLFLRPRFVPDREQTVFLMQTKDMNALNVSTSNTRYLYTISKEREFVRTNFSKNQQQAIRHNAYPSSSSPILPRVRTDGPTDVTKLTNTFYSCFAKQRKNSASTSQ